MTIMRGGYCCRSIIFTHTHLHILPAERAVATLNNVDKRVNLAVVMKLMEGKTFSMMHEVKEEN